MLWKYQPYLFYILSSSNIFITNFDSRMDQALHQLRGFNAQEESSVVSIASEEGRERRREGGRDRGRGEEKTLLKFIPL